MTPEKRYAKHINTIKRRLNHLETLIYQNSYDLAEMAALRWLLYHTTQTREDVAQAIDSVESHQLYKKSKGQYEVRNSNH